MLFNSFEFLLFLPLVFTLYWFVFNKALRNQNVLILVASYFFYGWWSWEFMLLLALSTLLDYLYGFYVASPNKIKSKIFLWLSIINNLGILGVFKYYNFFATQFQQGFERLGLHTNPVLLQIALPVGISFYTFHGMSYVFDIYRGHQKPVSNLVDYAVFVSFFPLLVAGPIERANHLLPQVQRKRSFNATQAIEGCRLILWGMFKKVVIADSLSLIVNEIIQNYQSYHALTLLCGVLGFSFQIYGDFSGYSDIALGTAKLFGFELLSNFKFPYFSRDIAEFWRRWHISLSSWFRDYLYIPLGGSKLGKIKAVRNTFIIFLVSGFWHGASWNFIIWGGIHAMGFLPLLLLNRNRQYVSDGVAQDRSWPSLKELIQMLSTFTFVSFAWIFFRIQQVDVALDYIKNMAMDALNHPEQFTQIPHGIRIVIYILPLIVLDWWFRKDERKLKITHSRLINYGMYVILATITIITYLNLIHQPSTFIYFQF